RGRWGRRARGSRATRLAAALERRERRPAATALANREHQVPLGGQVVRLEQQRFTVRPLRVAEVRLAARAVGPRLAQAEQAKIVQGAEPDLGVERRGCFREGGACVGSVSRLQGLSAEVVPGGVVRAAAGELLEIAGPVTGLQRPLLSGGLRRGGAGAD